MVLRQICQVNSRVPQVRPDPLGERMPADSREEGGTPAQTMAQMAAQMGEGDGGVGRGATRRHRLAQSGGLLVGPGNLVHQLDDVQDTQPDEEAAYAGSVIHGHPLSRHRLPRSWHPERLMLSFRGGRGRPSAATSPDQAP